jgi:hypothetical protein
VNLQNGPRYVPLQVGTRKFIFLMLILAFVGLLRTSKVLDVRR